MARRLFLALLALLAVLDLVILGIRLGDTFALGRLYLLPAEGPVLYAIWKVQHGYPLYEDPFRPYFTLTLYNVLFYEAYAWILSLLRVGTAAFPIAGRVITAAFAALGAAAQYAVARRLVPASRGFRFAAAAIAIATWFGAALPGWWALSIRPDVPAAALSTCGIAAALATFSGRDRRWLLAAGAGFALAWTFKQSQVALFAATCVYVAAWRRSRRELALVALPFAITVVVAIGIGGSVYRANILDAPRVNGLIPYLAIYWYRSVVLTDLLLWGVALWAIVAIVRPGSPLGPPRSLADLPRRSRELFGADVTYPALAAVFAFALGAILLAKIGSALNHVLELNVAAALVCTAVLGGGWESPRRPALFTIATIMLLPMVAFQLALLRNDVGRAATMLQLKGWGTRLHLTTPAQAATRARIAAAVAGLPHPVFTDDELFAQPSYATGGAYPTVMIDHVFYDAARAKGLVGGGLERLFADRYFASAVVPPSSALLTVALRAGYRQRSVIAQPGGETLYVLVREP
jgi:hypothetical protein